MGNTGKTVRELKKVCRLHRAAAVCVIIIILTTGFAFRVAGGQEIYMEAGDTAVLPCLLELWSDQSFYCEIGNPDVLMTDGSGRAVIALRAGRSDVYVHITNPDMDVQYTFIVTDPAAVYEEPHPGEIWQETLPSYSTSGSQETGSSGRSSGHSSGEENLESNTGAGASTGSVSRENGDGTARGSSSVGSSSVGSSSVGSSSVGSSSGSSSSVGSSAVGSSQRNDGAEAASAGNESREGAGGQSDRTGLEDDGSESGTSEGDVTPSAGTTDVEGIDNSSAGAAPEGEDTALPGTAAVEGEGTESTVTAEELPEMSGEEKRPYWENQAEGGIRFIAVKDGRKCEASCEEGSASGDVADRADMYRECVRIESDGEVLPVFVCANGRDIPFKYMGGSIYVKETDFSDGTVRGGVLDCTGKMYFFSC